MFAQKWGGKNTPYKKKVSAAEIKRLRQELRGCAQPETLSTVSPPVSHHTCPPSTEKPATGMMLPGTSCLQEAKKHTELYHVEANYILIRPC